MKSVATKYPRKKPSEEELKKFRKVDPVVFEDDLTFTTPRRASVQAGIEEYTGDWSDIQVAHLLKRTLFGVKKSEVNHFKGMSMSEAVDQIVTSSVFPDPPINNYEISGGELVDPDVPIGETWVDAPNNSDLSGYRIQSLKGWMVDNILQQETTIHQKLALFWHNLLVTQFWGIFEPKASYQYYKLLYDNAFGNYKSLIKQLTIDPAMLLFLNGAFNYKEAPDENYARELQELFCIGKGPNAGFTESDVQEAAKILTGWVINWDDFHSTGSIGSYFYAPLHHTADKQFSSFYGNRLIAGRSGEDGAEETDELLDMIFDNDETALYICRRLYNFFVYHGIDETTEANVIVPLANIFRSNNYEILPVIRALFKSAHFYDEANIGAAIKNPADHKLGLWRTMEIDLSEQDIHESYFTQLSLIWTLSELGMDLGDPPSVSGWQAYYQEPSFDKLWINTDTITKRALRQDSILFPGWGHWVSQDIRINADLLAFVSGLDQPEDPNALIEEISLLVHGISLNQEIRDGFKSILLSGQTDDYYWTDAWNAYTYDPTNETNRTIVENRLVSFFQPFFQLGEFQLM